MLTLLFVAHLFFASASECDTATEDTLKQAISEEPTRLVRTLDGQDLATFISNLTLHGYLVGSISDVDRIYIVDAGKRPGYTTDNVWLFFMQDGCVIAKVAAMKSIIVGLLP